MTAVGVNASIVGGNPTGLGIYCIRLVDHLDRLRDDLVLYTSAPEAFAVRRARIVRIPASTRPDHSMRGHIARVAWLQSGLRLRARRDRLDVLLNPVPEGIVATRLAQVTIIHDLLPVRFPEEYPRQQYYFKLFVPRVLRASRLVVADSESTRDDVITRLGIPSTSIRTIHAGCDEDVFFLDPEPSRFSDAEPYCLYVGNLLPHKNLLVLLDAIALVRRRVRCRLIIRGDGRADYRRLLEARIEALRLSDAVTFMNYVPDATLRTLYHQAACVVLPSLGEGFGLPVIEAMACGTPVIIADQTSLPEVASGAALPADPRDPATFAAAIERVLCDETLRKDLRDRGLARAAELSWRRTAEQISQALDEVLAKR